MCMDAAHHNAFISAEQVLLGLVQAEQVAQILWLESIPAAATQQVTAEHHKVSIDNVAALTARTELAVAHQHWADRPKAEGQHLLARLRDVIAPKVLLSVAVDHPSWSAADFIALGFQAIHEPVEGMAFYGFDIQSYKQTPDWLNPRFWANPQLWNQYRW